MGEDATRLISRVEYDNETDKLVGFVLPSSDDGLPLNDSFIAVSFESIEQSFKDGEIAKYAFVLWHSHLLKVFHLSVWVQIINLQVKLRWTYTFSRSVPNVESLLLVSEQMETSESCQQCKHRFSFVLRSLHQFIRQHIPCRVFLSHPGLL